MRPLKDLRPYQKKCIYSMLKNDNLGLFIGIGLGKTVISLLTVRRLLELKKIKRVLIVGPIKVIENVWMQEAKDWEYINDLSFTILRGKDKDKNFRKDVDIHLINYEGMLRLCKKLNVYKRNKKPFPYDVIILDESTKIKSNQTGKLSKRFKGFKTLFKLFKRRYILTATPTPEHLINIWSQMFVLDLGEALGTSLSDFKLEHFNEPRPYIVLPRKGAFAFVQNAIKGKTIRLKSEDYISMPEYVDHNIKIEFPKNILEQYEALEKEFFLEFEGGEVEALNSASLSIKLRQFIQGSIYLSFEDKKKRVTQFVHDLKIKAIREVYETTDENFLVAIQFRFELEMLKKEFGQDIPFIAGGVKSREASKHIINWNKGKIRMLFCHPQSMSEGLNLQKGGHSAIWYGFPWSYYYYDQFNGRIRRSGQESKFVKRIHIYVENTIDEIMMKSWSDKDANQEKLLKNLRSYISSK